MSYRKLTVLPLIVLSVLACVSAAFAQDTEEKRDCPAFENAPTEVRRSYYMGEGFAFVETGQYGAALNSYSCIIEQINEKDIDSYLNRAIVHTLRRSYDLAIEDYTAAIALDSNYAPAYLNRAVAHMARQEYDEAMADFDRAIEIDSNYSYAYNNRGVLHAAQEEYDAALADWQKVIEIEGFEPILALREAERQAAANGEAFTQEIPDYDRDLIRVYAFIGMIEVRTSLTDFDRYLLLAGPRADSRIESAAGSLASRFQFDLRFDDTWILAVDFIGDE
jgi:tetratricopeptide (TPR) repeat protein